MKLHDFFGFSGDTFVYYPSFCRHFDINANAAILLCYVGWKAFENDPNGWKAVNAEQITRDTGLGPKEQINARKALVDRKLIDERYVRLDHQMFIRLAPKQEELTPNRQNGDSPFPESPERRMASVPNGDSSIDGNNDLKNRSTPIPPKGRSRRESKPLMPETNEVIGNLKTEYLGAKSRRFIVNGPSVKAISDLLAQGVSKEEMAHVGRLAFRQTDAKKCWRCCKIGGAEDFARFYATIREELNGQLQSAMAGSVGVMKDPSGQRDEVIHAKILKI